MATNSHLFGGGDKKRSQPPYKKVEILTVATTLESKGKHKAVVLFKHDSTKQYEALHFESFDSRVDALQRAHYINANMILRTGDPLPVHGSGGMERSLAIFKERNYAL